MTPKRKKITENLDSIDESFFHCIKSFYYCNNCQLENIRINNGNHFILQIPNNE